MKAWSPRGSHYQGYQTARRQRVRYSVGFNPTSISGLRQWNDVSQMPVVADSTEVTSFTDFSGNGNHFAGQGATKYPLYMSAIYGSKPVLRFDGTNDWMQSSPGADTSLTIFIVMNKRSAPAAADKPQLCFAYNTSHILTNSATHATGANWNLNQAGASVANLFPSTTTYGIHIVRVNSASSLDGGKNGGALTNFDPNDAVTTVATRTIASESGARFSDIDVAEYVEYNSALANSDMDLVGKYLANKYSLTWTAVS